MPEAYRLPGDVRPARYEVHIHAEVGKPRFTGSVTIALNVERKTRAIELHSRDIEIVQATLDGHACKVQYEPTREMVKLELAREAERGEATLVIEYRGRVSEGMEGLYLSKDGPEEMLVTQCQETKARAVFPCFDEPAYKARLAWVVTTTQDVAVLANGALSRVEIVGNNRVWRFHDTPPISTYLACVAIGRFAAAPAIKQNGVPFRVWAVGGKENLGEFGNELAARLLPWFEDYFGKPYPYGKYDQIAVPSFSAGAMENAGLVVFRQAYLLRDPKASPFTSDTHIARVVAHEFAHMWFGDLVTFDWWDDTWLNESFAEWIATKVVDEMEPQYRVWLAQQQERLVAMASDALESTHPIYSPVATPEEATELFDAITYFKGAAVMRMLENYLGPEHFRAGIRTYMTEFAEKNARGHDLWRHLERASGQPVSRLMESWILRGGYPIVSVERAGDHGLRLRQERFLSAPGAKRDTTPWVIPIVVRFADDHGVHLKRVLMDKSEMLVDIPFNARFAHANAGSVGFYRQDLSKDLLHAAISHMKELAPAEQMGLLDDQWALFQKNATDASALLRALEAVLHASDEPRVLQSALARLFSVRERLEDAGADLQSYHDWVNKLVLPKLDSPGSAFRRAVLLQIVAGQGHHGPTIDEVRKLADAEMVDPLSIDPDLADPAVKLAAQFGDAARLEAHIATYARRRVEHAPPAQVERYLESLAEFRSPDLVKRVLQYSTSGEMPLEAVGPTLRLLMRKRHARVQTWAHVRANWAFVRRLGDLWTGGLVERAGDLPPEMKGEVVEFLDANLKGVATQAFGRAVETLDQRAWFEPRARRLFAEWFETHAPGRVK